MACQILVSNNSNTSRGNIIAIVDDSHIFSANESMQEFLKVGGAFENWPRVFSLVKVTDKTKEELEYLKDQLISFVTAEPEAIGPKYSFAEPAKDSTEWMELYLDGEIERPFNVVESFIIENT